MDKMMSQQEVIMSETKKLIHHRAGATVYFVPTGNVLYLVAIPMALFNMLGVFIGTWVAIKRGTGFVRVLFLGLLVMLIIKNGLRHVHTDIKLSVKLINALAILKSFYILNIFNKLYELNAGANEIAV